MKRSRPKTIVEVAIDFSSEVAMPQTSWTAGFAAGFATTALTRTLPPIVRSSSTNTPTKTKQRPTVRSALRRPGGEPDRAAEAEQRQQGEDDRQLADDVDARLGGRELIGLEDHQAADVRRYVFGGTGADADLIADFFDQVAEVERDFAVFGGDGRAATVEDFDQPFVRLAVGGFPERLDFRALAALVRRSAARASAGPSRPRRRAAAGVAAALLPASSSPVRWRRAVRRGSWRAVRRPACWPGSGRWC